MFLAGRAERLPAARPAKVCQELAGFSRKVSVYTVGHNCREDVEAYIASQVDAARFADPAFPDLMKEFTTICGDVDLSLPTESVHGRTGTTFTWFWSPHSGIGLSTATAFDVARRFFQDRRERGYKISRLSVMPDHLHVSLRGNIRHSPQDIALGFQNNLAYALGQVRIWAD